MSLQILIEKSKVYDFQEYKAKSKESGRLEFISKFPLDRIGNLTLDEYVAGTDKNSFSYWLEFKKILFGIGGGNASKFGIYKGVDVNYYGGTGQNKILLEGKELESQFKKIKTAIITAIDYVKHDKISQIKNIDLPIWNMVLQKILMIYFPDKFISIGASDVLITLANDIGLKNVDLSPKNLIEINYECRMFISKIPEFKDWHYEKISTLIWENYRKDQVNDPPTDPEKIKCWLYSPGENARNWEEFYEKGIMGLGWDKIGDLHQYNNRVEIKNALVMAYGGEGSKKNDVSANDDFINKLKIGDIVIAKRGRGELLGYGIVKSNYEYDANRSEYQKIRKIEWTKKGNWKTDHSLALKTLTDITDYPSEQAKFDYYYQRLLDLMKGKNSYKELYIEWLKNLRGAEIDKWASYIKAIEILSEITKNEIFEEDNLSTLDALYEDLLKEQRNEKGKYFFKDAPSYGISGFYSVSIKSYSDFLREKNMPLNTILYGPPGTGKTFHSIDKAVEIVMGEASQDHEENKKKFDELRKQGQIEFLTFHQSYSYEDFVVGIAPDISSGTLRFEKREGIFKVLADKAKQNWVAATNKKEVNNDFNFVFNSFFSKLIEEEVSEIEIQMKNKNYKFKVTSIDFDNGRLKFTKQSGGTGHDFLISNLKAIYEGSYIYGVEGLGVYYNPLVERLREYAKTLQPQAKSDVALKKFVLIIDEINRANISKVFGELITLLEDDKRLGEPNELKITLPNAEKEFGVPPNLYIIGTMNTADKSIALIDIALRRRFEFIGYYPTEEVINKLQSEGKLSTEKSDLLKKLNKAVFEKRNRSADYLIGHAYFINNRKIEEILLVKVIPLLMEYFSGKTTIVAELFSETAYEVRYDDINYKWEVKKK